MSSTAFKSLPTSPGLDRISKHDFQRLAQYIHDYCGIELPPSKVTMVEGRLRRRLRALNFNTIDAYCEYIFDQGGLHDEAVHLINVLTTNKTDFYRERGHFDFIENTVLPEFVAHGRNHIKAWSAACSTGAEPYTLAMIIDAFLAQNACIPYSVLATDLSTDVLEVAQRGIYPEELLAPVPRDLRSRYARESKDPSARLCRIAPALRAHVSFMQLNLMDAHYPVDRDMDIILCRNVLIYFSKPTQQTVLNKLCEYLRPGGYLFLGHSEINGGDETIRGTGR